MPTMEHQRLITELQTHGLKLQEASPGVCRAQGRRRPFGSQSYHHQWHYSNGAHLLQALPVSRPYSVETCAADANHLTYQQQPIQSIEFPKQPRFYSLSTSDGTPLLENRSAP